MNFDFLRATARSAGTDLGIQTASAKVLDRRQILKAGAWAAPIIVLATAAPAAAASTVVPDKSAPAPAPAPPQPAQPTQPAPSVDSLRFSSTAVWQGGNKWNVGTPWEGFGGTPGQVVGNFWIENRSADQSTGLANKATAVVTVIVTRSDLPGQSRTFTHAIPFNEHASENPFTWDNPNYAWNKPVTVTFNAVASGFKPAAPVTNTVVLG
ncbi:hypothetical protein [Microbacterium terregens]|uniref:Uncharacterized protein n=1 Tax=Microbacterium terregens TaxID=69363 RepID=A0ABV5T6B2_9MICO